MWFEKSSDNETHRYAPVDPANEDQPQRPPHRRANLVPPLYFALGATIVAIIACVSFVAGILFGQQRHQKHPNCKHSPTSQYLPTSSFAYHDRHPVPTIRKALQPDHTFMIQPSNPEDHTWDPIFPATGSFFPHPDIFPERGTLSVFHQLHCLNAIRHIYWNTVSPSSSSPQTHDGAGHHGPGDPAYDK